MEALLIHCLHTNFCLMKVSTRFLSASPPIYWAAAHILASPNCSSKRWGYLICVYFIAYILLGSLLFSNFYPFTQEPWHSWLQHPTVNTTMDLYSAHLFIALGALTQLVGAKGFRSQALPGSADIYVDSLVWNQRTFSLYFNISANVLFVLLVGKCFCNS